MGRSLAAIFSGFLFVLALMCLASLVLWVINPEALPGADDEGAPAATSRETLLLLLSLTVLSGLLGGYLTGFLAERNEGFHGLGAGLLVGAVLTLSAFGAQAGYVPLWYQIAFPLGGCGSTILGGFLRQQKRRSRPT